MLSTTVILIRHAHVGTENCGPRSLLCGWHDVPLSSTGLAQAEELGRRLGGCAATAIYTSPLARARQTAEPLTVRLGLPLLVDEGLREINCGELDGRTFERVEREHAALWRENLSKPLGTFRWPGGESYDEFRARVFRTLDRLVSGHPGERIVAVTHTGFISQVFGSCAGLGAGRWDRFRPAHASVSELTVDATGIRPVSFEERPVERADAAEG